jgi:hypothetical protein
MATPSCLKMVRSIFSPGPVGVWGRYLALLGIGGFCLCDQALITCCSAERGGGRERLLRKTPIYHDSPALGMAGLAISSATVLLPHVISLLVVRWLT